MEAVAVACLVGSALIHALPLVGVLGPAKIAQMYGVEVQGPDLAVLLVHRAILFGLLAAALVAAIFWAEMRPVAIGAVLVSDLAFLTIAQRLPGLNDAMKRVVHADLVSIGLLAMASGFLLSA